MQRRAAIWILGAFKTSPLKDIEALMGITPIRFHLQKIAKRSQICPFKLPDNHILKNLLDNLPSRFKLHNSHNIGSLTNHQRSLTKGHLINSSIKSYGIFPSFSPLDPEFFPGYRIIDNFSNQFSFNLVNKKDKNPNETRAQELDEMVLQNSLSPHSAIVITGASIKNDIAMSISHTHSANQPLTKTVHHVSFITTIEAELFAIRCGINQACSINNVSKIIIITDSIHAAKKIFDCEVYPLQIHTAAILDECHIQVHLSGKLHPRGDATSEPYKPAFHGGHLSRNTSYGGAATLRIFCLPWRRYSYSTRSSMTELLLSVSQH